MAHPGDPWTPAYGYAWVRTDKTQTQHEYTYGIISGYATNSTGSDFVSGGSWNSGYPVNGRNDVCQPQSCGPECCPVDVLDDGGYFTISYAATYLYASGNTSLSITNEIDGMATATMYGTMYGEAIAQAEVSGSTMTTTLFSQ